MGLGTRKWGWTVAALLASAPAAHAVRFECQADNGNVTCPQTGTGSPEPPRELPTVTVVGSWSREQFDRFVWEASNRQTTSPAPGVQDIGGNGTEGNGGGDSSSCDPVVVGNPVIPSTGNKIEIETDFTSGGEMPLFLTRTWNHHTAYPELFVTMFGTKWVSNFDLRLLVSSDQSHITAYRSDGSQVRYRWSTAPSAGWWEDRPEARSYIVADGSGGYVLHARGRHDRDVYGLTDGSPARRTRAASA